MHGLSLLYHKTTVKEMVLPHQPSNLFGTDLGNSRHVFQDRQREPPSRRRCKMLKSRPDTLEIGWTNHDDRALRPFPIWITVNFLGNPDNGVIVAGYLASLIMAGGYLAIGSCISAVKLPRDVSNVAVGLAIKSSLVEIRGYLSTRS